MQGFLRKILNQNRPEMNSKERLQTTLQHRQPDKICVDFGSTAVTGIHVGMIETLRRHYGLDDHPVKVTDPFQMLGEIEEDLRRVIGVDVLGLGGRNSIFGYPFADWKEFRTPWGQVCLVPGGFTTDIEDSNGDLLMFPEGDTSASASARMPAGGYFYDAIVRQKGEIDDTKLDPADNLEEFQPFDRANLDHIRDNYRAVADSGMGLMFSMGGTALGDIAFVPGMQLKNPKGIRDIAEWYMSTVMRPDYLHEIFERQTETALENLQKVYDIVGNGIDAINLCGTDFGTQDSQFCSAGQFDELYKPYYRRLNDWIHANTSWKTFKHSCGAIVPLLPNFIEAGFDCINPVQINAKDMDPAFLKREFGDKVVFWGGGVNTQTTLMYGTPSAVADEVRMLCDVFGRDGGFVFNAVHNVQANVPVENVVAMIDTIREINGV